LEEKVIRWQKTADKFELKKVKVSIRKEALYKMILEDMMAGLRDNEIIEKRKIPGSII
jgi:hypothetical protein